jgi:hypothetical protein
MFRRYFQTGEEEDADGSSGEEEVEVAEQLPPPEEVWAQVSWRSALLLLAGAHVGQQP